MSLFAFKYSIILSLLLTVQFAFANQARLLVSDNDALSTRIELIQNAKSEILVEYFSIWNDDQVVNIFAVLLKAAQRGVKVKLIMDSLASSVPRSLISLLKTKGVDSSGIENFEIKVYNPPGLNFFNISSRNHSKMLIVDQKTVINGGRNMVDKYFGFNKNRNYIDLDVIISGEIAQVARDNFFKVWESPVVNLPLLYENDPIRMAQNSCQYVKDSYESECENLRNSAIKQYKNELNRIEESMKKIDAQIGHNTVLEFGSVKSQGTVFSEPTSIEFLSHEPTELVSKRTNSMTAQILNQLAQAKEEVLVISPYVILEPEWYTVFNQLLNKGVQIKLITNSLRSTDSFFAQSGYRAEKKKMSEMGIEIYEYNGPNTMHAKGFLIDRSKAIIGTFNLDPRSMYINREVGFVIAGSQPLNSDYLNFFNDLVANSTVVAKNKKQLNTDQDFNGVPAHGKFILNFSNMILPLIRHLL